MFNQSRPYHKLSQNSDSDDDEVILYAATPLNADNQISGDDQPFGSGIYNRDLRLNLHSPTPLKLKTAAKQTERRNVLCSVLFCAAVCVVLLGLALTVIVYAQVYLPSPSANQTTTSPQMCKTAPPPLEGNGNGCVGTPTDNVIDPTTEPNTDRPTTEPNTHSLTTELNTDNPTTELNTDGPTTEPNTDSPTTRPNTHSPTTRPNTHSPTTEPNTDSPTTEPNTDSPTTDSPTTRPKTHSPTIQPDTTTVAQASKVTTKPSTVKPETVFPSNEAPSSSSSQGVNWTREFFPSATELSLQLYDMNRDGTLDIVTSQVFDPCVVKILALDGVTSETVWERDVNFPVFAFKCEFDVNGDGITDCLASGRSGGFTALNGVDGSTLWVVDRNVTYPIYNYYYPLIVGDLDSDGVPDLINTHGGDTTYEPEDKERSPGFLVAVSGRTGEKLMEPILTPDGHETYNSPVLFKLAGEVELVLFGTGGETVSGSLWAVTLDSIRTRVLVHKARANYNNEQYAIDTDDTYHPCYLKDVDLESLRPSFNASYFDIQYNSKGHGYLKMCPKLRNNELIWNIYDICLYEILQSTDKGIMLPPLIVDLNADSMDDLLVSTYDGHNYAYDGKDLTTVLWDAHYPDTESYSLPAPLFYSEDFFPDLLLRANRGEWGNYSSSSLHLVDGRTGRELWSIDSAYHGMMSGLSVASDAHGKDAMLFITIGDRSTPNEAHHEGHKVRRHGEMQGAHDHKNTDKEPNDLWTLNPEDPFPDPEEDLDGFLGYCGHSVRELSAFVYLVTRGMVEEGKDIRPIAVERPLVFKGSPADYANSSDLIFKRQTHFNMPAEGEAPVDYSNPSADYESNYEDVNFGPSKHDIRCSHILAPIMIVATPTIGDVNGDGRLEMAYTAVWGAVANGHKIEVPPIMKVRTFTLEDNFVEVYGPGVIDFNMFLPPEDQPWTRYMGGSGDNVYHPLHRLRDI